jgi:outer membrane protein
VRNFTLSLLLGALALASGSAFAELKIAVVDPLAAVNASEQYTKAMADLEKDTATDKAKLTKLQAEPNTCAHKMKTDGATMSQTDAARLKSDCEAKYRDYQQIGQTFQKIVNERQQAVLQDIGPKFQRALDTLAKEAGYDLVITREAAPFVKPMLDITDKVTIKLNTTK